jgi:hypothetical protein
MLIVVVLSAVALYGLVYAISRASDAVEQANDRALSVNVVYGQALRACEEDERICSFPTLESAEKYLNSPEHKASAAIRDLKRQQNAAANAAASAAIERSKHQKTGDRVRKLD